MSQTPTLGIQRGDIVRTSYDSGPYEVVKISGPCTCPPYLSEIAGESAPSEPHYHLRCRGLAAHHGKNALYHLGGYRMTGGHILNVWNADELFVAQAAQQQELF